MSEEMALSATGEVIEEKKILTPEERESLRGEVKKAIWDRLKESEDEIVEEMESDSASTETSGASNFTFTPKVVEKKILTKKQGQKKNKKKQAKQARKLNRKKK